MELRYSLSKKFFLVAGLGALMVLSSYFIYAYDPMEVILNRILLFGPNTLFFNLWSTPPYEVFIKIYIFNVTNGDRFINGEDDKLNFTEIGPYVYNEILTNENATFNEDGTVTFQPKRVMVFDQSRSVGNPYTDRIITPNLPLLGIQSFLADKSFFKGMAFAALSKMLGSPALVNVTIDQYLWGYSDRLVEMANEFLPSWIDFDTFGIVDRLLSRDNSNTVTLALKPDQIKTDNPLLTDFEKAQLYHIVEWNNSPGLPEWGYEPNSTETKRCSLIEGAFEGTIMPPHMERGKNFQMFRKAFCRPVPLVFEKETLSKHGYDAFNFKISEDFLELPEYNPDNECFCYKGNCLPKGIATIAPCYYDIPITISLPHFMDADPVLVEKINGMNPVREVHESIAQVHPKLGIPLDGHLKIQINLYVGETKYNVKTRPFNNMALPLFWVEMTMEDLPMMVKVLVTSFCHVFPIVQEIAMYLLGILGLACISGSALLVLCTTKPTVPRGLSLSSEYSPIPIITISQQYFKPDIRIS